jgi:hypothetical protein
MHYNKRTDENSMLFNASYLLRLAFPLGYNFVGLAKAKVRASIENVRLLLSLLPSWTAKLLPISSQR